MASVGTEEHCSCILQLLCQCAAACKLAGPINRATIIALPITCIVYGTQLQRKPVNEYHTERNSEGVTHAGESLVTLKPVNLVNGGYCT